MMAFQSHHRLAFHRPRGATGPADSHRLAVNMLNERNPGKAPRDVGRRDYFEFSLGLSPTYRIV
jgi:hypothetical protein